MNARFQNDALTDAQRDELSARRNRIAADIVRLTSLAGSGHPGGSLSTLDALLTIYGFANIGPENVNADDRDRVIISHGHISPGVYGTLAAHGFFDIKEAYNGFRKAGSVFGGHIEKEVPGVEWNTGNLGQGLSAGCGFAVANRARGIDANVFVGMGDGEQQKGQISEARRFAAKYKLSNLIAFVDVNGLQIGGSIDDVMPMNLNSAWRADGWNVVEVDGHDADALYAAFRAAVRRESGDADAPTVLMLRTVMGAGIEAIEGDAKYHGSVLSDEQARTAFEELGQPWDLDDLRSERSDKTSTLPHEIVRDTSVQLDCGTPRTYETTTNIDCRSAYGNALADIARVNAERDDSWPVLGFSVDLEGSVKMNGFHAATPENFYEAGISEHHTAVMTGAASICGVVPFFSTFGMFGIVEVYNQQRLNDQNGAAPRVVVTHCGLDVGADGPTHQCIDYVSLLSNPYGFEVYAPADANECDRIIRAVAGRYAPVAVAMGRSKFHPIADTDGQPAFAGEFKFEPGVWTTLREGKDVVVMAFGVMVPRAVEVADELASEGISVRVLNASSLKPFDEAAILRAADDVGKIITYEDHNKWTGLGAIVTQTLGRNQRVASVETMGVGKYGSSGAPDDLFAEQGISRAHLADQIRTMAAE